MASYYFRVQQTYHDTPTFKGWESSYIIIALLNGPPKAKVTAQQSAKLYRGALLRHRFTAII